MNKFTLIKLRKEEIDTWYKHARLSERNVEQSCVSGLAQVLQQCFVEVSGAKAEQNQWQRLYSQAIVLLLGCQPTKEKKVELHHSIKISHKNVIFSNQEINSLCSSTWFSKYQPIWKRKFYLQSNVQQK